MIRRSISVANIARGPWLGRLALFAALIVTISLTAQAAGLQSAARAAAMRRCNIQADRLYTGDQEVQTRWLMYEACMISAGFVP
jgi:hypothetical protein